MRQTPMTSKQQHWLLWLNRHKPALCFKVPKVTGEALVERGLAIAGKVPLSDKQGFKITAKGERFAKSGEK